jgi:hypothetical protein
MAISIAVATIATLLTLAAISVSLADTTGSRDRISLAGAWKTCVTTDAGKSAPNSGWTDVDLPKTFFQGPDGGPHFVWYEKQIAVPAQWTGRRIFCDFRGVRYAPQLYVDGKLAGSQFNGFAPFKTEITSYVRPGQTVTLDLRCEDRSALFAAGYTPGPGVSERASMIAPAGGYRDSIGVWDELWMESTPQTRIDEDTVAIVASTRARTLTVSGRADGGLSAGQTVTATVLDGAAVALRLPQATVSEDGTWTVTAPFPNAHDWSPWDPHLYDLKLDLSSSAAGDSLDTLEETFGFKEIWTSGPDFYLNGVKIHLLGSATWPLADYETNSVIDAKVAAIRASNTVVFRLHNETWQEEWLRAADRVGLMIIDESPLYTDGDGAYAYNDPQFWANYRDQIKGMIDRDRNHACLAMWSMENEELFMSNQRYDQDLPKQLGDVGRYAKTLDPSHPITFEADQDPDGAADCLGLHYPHEMPWVTDWPNTADWLGARTTTQAGGGLLGTRSTSFFWDRKKPLYVGEYLWLPQSDYSDATIYYGDDAYLNRDKYYNLAKMRAFYDQSIGFRRSGVSGMSPWTVFGFGGVTENPFNVATEKDFYTPVAAFPKDRGFRFYGARPVQIHFDVFDDDGKPHNLDLRLIRDDNGAVLASEAVAALPGDYHLVTLAFTAPAVSRDTVWKTHSELRADGTIVHQVPLILKFFKYEPLRAPAGVKLFAFDPTGAWPSSHTTLAGLKATDPRRTVLIVAPNAFGAADSKVATITAGGDASAALQESLARGGRALVLDQTTLGPLGLDLDMADHASTMTFGLNPRHPILAGLDPDDLSYWRGDNYVTQLEVRRTGRHGVRAITVSGGQDCLAQAPIVEAPAGNGWVVVVQALAAEKRAIEPAAQRLVQNAVNYLAELPVSKARPAIVVSSDTAFEAKLADIGVAEVPNSASCPAAQTSLILDGGGPAVTSLAGRIAATLESGGTVYWHSPDPDSLASLKGALRAGGLSEIVAERGTSLIDRADALTDGIAREDLTYQIISQAWDRGMRPDVRASKCQFVPTDALAALSPVDPANIKVTKGDLAGGQINLDPSGTATVNVRAPRSGLYVLALSVNPAPVEPTFGGQSMLVRIDTNGAQSSWIPIGPGQSPTYDTVVDLAAGANTVDIVALGGPGARRISLAGIGVGTKPAYGADIDVLALPGSVVTWKVGPGRVVLDGMEWDSNSDNSARGERYAGALFDNIGVQMSPPAPASAAQSIGLSQFALVGASPYFSQTPSEMDLLSDGLVAAPVRFTTGGTYHFRIYARATPFHGVYAIARFSIDGTPFGDVEVKSPTPRWFDVGDVKIARGTHTVGLAFINDQSDANEDRNLYVQGVSVTPE